MKRILTLAGLSLLAVAGSAHAAPITIVDDYIGKMSTDPNFVGQDIIGTASRFDISHMTVDFTGTVLSVSIFSQYFDNVGISDTNLGDLFISTNGWNPFGPAPYVDDNSTNGEAWELALVLSNRGEKMPEGVGVSMLGESGVASLYSVLNENIVYASGPVFREGQEVQYEAGQQQALGFGSWEIIDVVGSAYDELRFVIDLAGILGIGDVLGFHWTMSCANDVIEGSAPIPEPASMLLLASALGAAVPLRKRLAA